MCIIAPAKWKVLSMMKNTYCYSFFFIIYPMWPFGGVTIKVCKLFCTLHKLQPPQGGKSLLFPPRITDRKLEQFHVSVSIAAASKVTFELTYEELLKRQLGKYELLIKVRPKQLVKHFQVSCPGEGWQGAVLWGLAQPCSLWDADVHFFFATRSMCTSSSPRAFTSWRQTAHSWQTS